MSNMMAYLPYWVRYDKDLTNSGKLVYAELTANTDRNRYMKGLTFLAKKLHISERAVQLNVNELADKGYIYIEGEKKRRVIYIPERRIETITTVQYMPSDLPDKDELPFFTKVIDLWNKGVDAQLKLTGTVMSHLRARLSTFKKEEIIDAMNNRIAFMERSPWHLKEENRKHKINIDLVIRNDEEMDKWLNTRVSSSSPKYETIAHSNESSIDLTE